MNKDLPVGRCGTRSGKSKLCVPVFLNGALLDSGRDSSSSLQGNLCTLPLIPTSTPKHCQNKQYTHKLPNTLKEVVLPS